MKTQALVHRRLLRHPAPWAFVVLAAMAGLVPGSARAGVIDPAYEAYLNTLPEDQKVSVLIYMADQAPIAQMDADLRAEEATLAARHEQVITALMDRAAETQPALLAELSARLDAGEVVGYTPYWIANLVVAQMTVRAVREVAARPDVGTVYANFTVSLIEPVGGPKEGGDPPVAAATPGVRAINAHRVWYELGITGAGRLVGGLDTGVMGTHPALSARWRGAGGAVPWQQCWLDRLGGGTQFPTDAGGWPAGHGTHTMGTMVGLGAATQDTIGVAWGAKWIACNAINQNVGAEFDNDVIAAFQWFADPDGNPQTTVDVPDVVQNSWRINEGFPGGYTDCDPRWWAVMDGCEAAGCAVVFSAGNEGPGAQTIGSPPDRITTATNAFAIGAVNATSFGFPYPIWSLSSRGPSGCNGVTIKPEVVAPGVTVRSSFNNGGYTDLDGTSMAGPHVSGICALMRQANPNIAVTTMKQIIMNTARDLGAAGEDNTYGWGVVDAYAAVREAICTAHSPLASGASVLTPAPAGYYNFSQPTIYWSAAAVRSTTDWDIRLYQNPSGGSGNVCFSGLLASSVALAGTTDFVIGDFNHNVLGTYYVYDYQYPDNLTLADGRTEWDDSADALFVNGPLVSRSTGATDLIEVWDVFLEAGTAYTIEFLRFGADAKVLLFHNPASAAYWAGRSSRVLESTTTTTYTAPASDWYGVVVVNDDGGAGGYTLRVGTCTAPVALTSGASVLTPASVGYYSFAQPTIYWSAVGVRAATDWDIQVFQTGSGGSWPACFSNVLASATGVGIADFVIGDFNHNALGTYYAWPYAFTGVGDATTEWDDGANSIGVGGGITDRDTDAADVLEVWDVFLNANTEYDIYFERTGAADTKLLLFQSQNGTYWTGRTGAQLVTTNLHTFYTAPANDWYGIVVVNDSGADGHYRLGISPASAAAGDRGPRGVPALTALRPAAPNPAAGDVQIGFDLRDPGAVGLEILDVAGRVVAVMPSRTWEAGTWQTRWDGRGQDGRRMPAGVYWVRMSIGVQEIGRSKFILLR